MFSLIEEDEALLYVNGVYKVSKLYEYRGGLYAGVPGGYIRLKTNGSTSVPSHRLEELHRDGHLFQDKWGRLCVLAADDRRRLELDEQGQAHLIEGPAGEKLKPLKIK